MAMRFLIGFGIGFGIGFAGAVLLAPERKRGEQDWPAGTVEPGASSLNGTQDLMGTFRRAIQAVQDHVNEALEEAKKAQAETEREMLARYERKVNRTADVPPTVEEAAPKGKKAK
jgi:gas vesicle protein